MTELAHGEHLCRCMPIGVSQSVYNVHGTSLSLHLCRRTSQRLHPKSPQSIEQQAIKKPIRTLIRTNTAGELTACCSHVNGRSPQQDAFAIQRDSLAERTNFERRECAFHTAWTSMDRVSQIFEVYSLVSLCQLSTTLN